MFKLNNSHTLAFFIVFAEIKFKIKNTQSKNSFSYKQYISL